MEDPKELVDKVKDLIGTNQTEKAIELLEAAEASLIETELILIKADFYKVTDQQQIGIIDNDASNLELRKINNKLVQLCNKLERKEKDQLSPQGQTKSPRNKYLISGLIVGIPVTIIALLFGFGALGSPFGPAPILSVPVVTEPKGQDFNFGDQVNISYNVPDYEGQLTISFIEIESQSMSAIKKGNMPANDSFSWDPPLDRSGQTGYIQIETKSGMVGKSAEITLLPPVEEEKIVDLKVDYFNGKLKWSKSPPSTGISGFEYAFTIDFKSKLINDSSVKGTVSGQLTLDIMSKWTSEWENILHRRLTLQEGEPKNQDSIIELRTADYGGEPLNSQDYIFKLCIENIKDGNKSNDCVIDTFRVKGVTY